MDSAAGERARLLDRARVQYRAGDVADAWRTCAELAELSRAGDDVVMLAEAAMVFRRLTVPGIRDRVNALAREALARLGDTDPERASRLRAQVQATDDAFLDHQLVGSDEEPSGDPEAVFLEVQAEIAALQNASHARSRLELSRRVVDLGRRHGVGEYECWGRRWRMDACAELGLRLELTDDLAASAPLVEHLGRDWQSVMLLVRASQSLVDGDFASGARLIDEARDLGGEHSEAAYFHLVFAFGIARMTGEHTEEVLERVRGVMAEMPYLARGWLCLALVSFGHREEAEQLWRSLAPHVDRMPERAPEWLIAAVGNAEVCVALDDRASGGRLYQLLLPYDGLHAIGLACAPYEGPVSLTLGRLAHLLGRRDDARRHLEDALASCLTLNAQPYAALTHAELAKLADVRTQEGRERAESALRIARRLGMHPLVAMVESWLEPRSGDGPLTPREREIAGLVAEGLTNGAIASRLTLSERTVENHVSRILRKLDLGSRTALAVWTRDRA